MEIKLLHIPYNIPLSSKLANYKTENIYNTLILNDKFDIYINGDYIKVLYCNKSTNLKTKSVCEVSKNSNDDFDKKIYNDIISGILDNDIGSIIASTQYWIIKALTI